MLVPHRSFPPHWHGDLPNDHPVLIALHDHDAHAFAMALPLIEATQRPMVVFRLAQCDAHALGWTDDDRARFWAVLDQAGITVDASFWQAADQEGIEIDVKSEGRHPDRALLLAIMEHDAGTTKVLLDHGASPVALLSTEDPFRWVMDLDSPTLLQVLFNHQIAEAHESWTDLQRDENLRRQAFELSRRSAEHGAQSCLTWLQTTYDLPWDQVGLMGFSLLYIAACNAHLNLVDVLLSKISDPAYLNHPTVYQVTPLSQAAENGHVEVVERLLNAGALNDPLKRGARIDGSALYMALEAHQDGCADQIALRTDSDVVRDTLAQIDRTPSLPRWRAQEAQREAAHLHHATVDLGIHTLSPASRRL